MYVPGVLAYDFHVPAHVLWAHFRSPGPWLMSEIISGVSPNSISVLAGKSFVPEIK